MKELGPAPAFPYIYVTTNYSGATSGKIPRLPPPLSCLAHLKCCVNNLINDRRLGTELLLLLFHPSHQLQELEMELPLPEGTVWGSLGWPAWLVLLLSPQSSHMALLASFPQNLHHP